MSSSLPTIILESLCLYQYLNCVENLAQFHMAGMSNFKKMVWRFILKRGHAVKSILGIRIQRWCQATKHVKLRAWYTTILLQMVSWLQRWQCVGFTIKQLPLNHCKLDSINSVDRKWKRQAFTAVWLSSWKSRAINSKKQHNILLFVTLPAHIDVLRDTYCWFRDGRRRICLPLACGKILLDQIWQQKCFFLISIKPDGTEQNSELPWHGAVERWLGSCWWVMSICTNGRGKWEICGCCWAGCEGQQRSRCELCPLAPSSETPGPKRD